jgi:hypothetical protein
VGFVGAASPGELRSPDRTRASGPTRFGVDGP